MPVLKVSQNHQDFEYLELLTAQVSERFHNSFRVPCLPLQKFQNNFCKTLQCLDVTQLTFISKRIQGTSENKAKNKAIEFLCQSKYICIYSFLSYIFPVLEFINFLVIR